MSNKLTFSEPGTAKVSWQVQYGEEQLDNSMLDSVVLNINGIPQSIDLTKNSTEIQVSKTTSVNMEVTYGGVTTKTMNLMVEILENDGPDEPDEPIQPTSKSVYYGSLTSEYVKICKEI